MALASGLVTAVDDQEQAAASLSNATPALLPPTIDKRGYQTLPSIYQAIEPIWYNDHNFLNSNYVLKG